MKNCIIPCHLVQKACRWTCSKRASEVMDTMVYLDQENCTLAAPFIKARQRLQSAPERLLKTPLKTWLGAPMNSGRKALGTVNKIVSTPATSRKGDVLNKPSAAQQCKVASQPVREDYPEIEKCFPYDPSDFEVYCVPEEVCLSRFSLAGLGKQQWPPNVLEEDFIEPCLPLSPLKMPSEHPRDDLEAFLETINELTICLPPECDS